MELCGCPWECCRLEVPCSYQCAIRCVYFPFNVLHSFSVAWYVFGSYEPVVVSDKLPL